MKRAVLYASVFALTFILGVGTTWGYRLVLQPVAASWWAFAANGADPSQGVSIRFANFSTNPYGVLAEYTVTNGGVETLYFTGYSKDAHCSYKINQQGIITQVHPCWCGTGLGQQELAPGVSATYQVSIHSVSGAFTVGFDFRVGWGRRDVTIWSDQATEPPPPN